MQQSAPHHLDRQDANRRRWLPRAAAIGTALAVLGAGLMWMTRTDDRPVEIDAVIAPPLYAHGALYSLTENGRLTDNQARVLTLAPGARLMVRIQNPPSKPYLSWRDEAHDFTKSDDGDYWLTLTIDNPGVLSLSQGNGQGHDWLISLTPDDPPTASFSDKPFVTSRNMVRFDVTADDDFGLGALKLLIAPASDTDVGSGAPMSVSLNLVGGNYPFDDTVYVDLRDTPLAGTMVRAWIEATDRRGQRTLSDPQFLKLPERRFRMAEARILASQPEKLAKNPAKTAEVATILHTIATRHIENDDMPAGKFLAFAVAYRRLTGAPLLDDTPFKPPLLPASPDQIAEATDLILTLAKGIEDGPLANTDPQFMAADRLLQNSLNLDTTPEEQESALWQYRYTLSQHLPALLFHSLQRQGHFLPALPGDDVAKGLKEFDTLSRQIGTDIENGDFQNARNRLAIMRDLVHNSQAGTVTAERDDLLGLLAETGSLLSQINQLQRDVKGAFDPARVGQHGQDAQSAITVQPFAPISARTATVRAEALYFRAKRRLTEDRVRPLLFPDDRIDETIRSQRIHTGDIQANLFQAQNAFNRHDNDAALSYLNQAVQHLHALTKLVVSAEFTTAYSLPPSKPLVNPSTPLSDTDYDRAIALLSAHKDFVGQQSNDVHAQFNQAMKLTATRPAENQQETTSDSDVD